MIAFVNGTVEYMDETTIVVDVNGVGYRVFMSPSNLARVAIGDVVKIHTFLRVAEGIMDLYGFLSIEELDMFKMIITVSGVGPKVGISVLSAATPAEFALAVVTDDFKRLTRAPGVGKKLAQKIVLELKDKLKKSDLIDEKSGSLPIGNPVRGSSGSEAVEALMVLGYNQGEAMQVVSGVPSDLSLENTIKEALKLLMK